MDVLGLISLGGFRLVDVVVDFVGCIVFGWSMLGGVCWVDYVGWLLSGGFIWLHFFVDYIGWILLGGL